jgi:hypothetical protein
MKYDQAHPDGQWVNDHAPMDQIPPD